MIEKNMALQLRCNYSSEGYEQR